MVADKPYETTEYEGILVGDKVRIVVHVEDAGTKEEYDYYGKIGFVESIWLPEVLTLYPYYVSFIDGKTYDFKREEIEKVEREEV